MVCIYCVCVLYVNIHYIQHYLFKRLIFPLIISSLDQLTIFVVINRKAVDLCILQPGYTLINSRRYLLWVLSDVLHKQSCHGKQKQFYFLLPNPCIIYFLSFSYYMARASTTVLNISGERNPSCPVPDLTRKPSSFSPLSMISATGVLWLFLQKEIEPLYYQFFIIMDIGWYQVLYVPFLVY